MLSSEDFENIRQLIMLQNDIKPQHFNAETEKLLYEMKIKLKSTRKDNSYTTMEDLITIVSYSMHISNEEFNRNLEQYDILLNSVTKEDELMAINESILSSYEEMVLKN